MNERESKHRPWKLRLGRALGKIAITIVFLELFFYVATWWFQIAPLILAEKSRGWRMAPGAMIPLTNEEGPYLFRVNAEGRRDEHARSALKGNRKRILVLGGSNTVGVSVPLEDVYTQVLQRAMPEVDVINLGVVVFELDQQLDLLREEVFRWKPDLVIHLVNQGTYKYIFRDYEPRMGLPRCRVEMKSEEGEYRLVPPSFPWWQPLVSRSALLTVFDMLLYRRWSSEKSPDEPSPMTPAQERVVKRLLLDSRDAARSAGSDYIAVMASPTSDADVLSEHSILTELAESDDFTFLDLGHLFFSDGSEGASPALVLREDPGHWSVYGHHAIGRELHRFLTQ